MAWGGLEEQACEWELGKVHAKDWQDEALKIVEKAMAEYWQEPSHSTVSEPPEATSATTSETSDAKIICESDFDHHCHSLIAQSAQIDDTGGWAAELH